MPIKRVFISRKESSLSLLCDFRTCLPLLLVLGVGRTAPDPNATVTLDGVQVPLGKGTNTNIEDTSLLYNEYPLLALISAVCFRNISITMFLAHLIARKIRTCIVIVMVICVQFVSSMFPFTMLLQIHRVRCGPGKPEVPAEDQVQLPDLTVVRGWSLTRPALDVE